MEVLIRPNNAYAEVAVHDVNDCHLPRFQVFSTGEGMGEKRKKIDPGHEVGSEFLVTDRKIE